MIKIGQIDQTEKGEEYVGVGTVCALFWHQPDNHRATALTCGRFAGDQQHLLSP